MTSVAQYRYGWFSPEGVFHTCDDYGHLEIAFRVAGQGHQYPMRILLDNGYVRVSMPYLEVRVLRNPNVIPTLKKFLEILVDTGMNEELEINYLPLASSFMATFERGTPIQLLKWLSEVE